MAFGAYCALKAHCTAWWGSFTEADRFTHQMGRFGLGLPKPCPPILVTRLRDHCGVAATGPLALAWIRVGLRPSLFSPILGGRPWLHSSRFP